MSPVANETSGPAQRRSTMALHPAPLSQGRRQPMRQSDYHMCWIQQPSTYGCKHSGTVPTNSSR